MFIFLVGKCHKMAGISTIYKKNPYRFILNKKSTSVLAGNREGKKRLGKEIVSRTTFAINTLVIMKCNGFFNTHPSTLRKNLI